MWIFEGDQAHVSFGLSGIHSRFTLDASKDPKRLNLITNVTPGRDVEVPCIYKLERDMLTLCFDVESGGFKKRQPKEFTGKAGTGMRLLVLKRAPAKGARPPEAVWREKATVKASAGWPPGSLPLSSLRFSPKGTALSLDQELADSATGKNLIDPRLLFEGSRWVEVEGHPYKVGGQFLGFTLDGVAWGLQPTEFRPDGKVSRNLAVIDWATGRKRTRLKIGEWDSAHRAVLSPDGKVLAMTTGGQARNQGAKLWHAETGTELRVLAGNPAEEIDWLAFSPDSRTLATTVTQPLKFGPQPDRHSSIKLWDVSTGKELSSRREPPTLAKWNFHDCPTRCVRFSPDGTKLAIICREYQSPGLGWQLVLRLWDVPSLQTREVFAGGKAGDLRDFAFSPDSKTVALVRVGVALPSKPGEKVFYTPTPLVLLDVVTGKEVGRIAPPRNGFAGVAFSPDGKLLATQDNDGTVKVWERASKR